METSTRGWLEAFGKAGVPAVDDLVERIDRAVPVAPEPPTGPLAAANHVVPANHVIPANHVTPASHAAPAGTPDEAAEEPEEDLSLAGAVLHPEDTDLPILVSLVESLCWNTAPSAPDDPYQPSRGGSHVAPLPVPLESLQSLSVSPRLL